VQSQRQEISPLRRLIVSFVDAGIVVRPGEGKMIKMPGHSFTYKAVKKDTGGAYWLLEVFLQVVGRHSISTRPRKKRSMFWMGRSMSR
jgi:hypothetical protein